jgi:hypothetical protein
MPIDHHTLGAGSLLSLHGRLHRIVFEFNGYLLIVDVASPGIYLVENSEGLVGLPHRDDLATLFAKGQALPAPSGDSAERMRVELALLDAAGVRNGTKAIAIWLDRNWTADLRCRFGDHDNAATLKRWRSQQRRDGRS